MTFKPFTEKEIPAAKKLAQAAYEAERAQVPALPPATVPEQDFEAFAANGLGVAAYAGQGESSEEQLCGYLCCHSPIENYFGLQKGVYTPAHGCAVALGSAAARDAQGREKLHSRLYQAAVQGWVEKDIYNHVITLWAHNEEGVKAFFQNGFGMRCVDAMAPLPLAAGTKAALPQGTKLAELAPGQRACLLPLFQALERHLARAPVFFPIIRRSDEEETTRLESREDRYFAVMEGDTPLAYIKLSGEGECFPTCCKGVRNISGAYCLPRLRGSGLYDALLAHVAQVLHSEGASSLGVDYESQNPTAWRYWGKHFTPYTYSLLRRVDERAGSICRAL